MEGIHLGGRILSPPKICERNILNASLGSKNVTKLSFTTDHRIHPNFMSNNHTALKTTIHDIGLAMSLHVKEYEFNILINLFPVQECRVYQ